MLLLQFQGCLWQYLALFQLFPFCWWHKKLFEDSVDQGQTAQNVQSDLWSTLSAFFTLDNFWSVSSTYNGIVFLSNEKLQFIYLVAKELKIKDQTAH